MTALNSLSASPAAVSSPRFCFSVLAEAEPGIMPRVLQLFAKRNLVPSRWHSDVIGADQRELAIDIQVQGVTPELGDYIARCLRQVHGVRTVLTSQKGIEDARGIERDCERRSA